MTYKYEAAIKFGGALESADRGTLFKASVKELGHKLGIMPSFMAKPSASLPGCSGHLHQNLASIETGKNTFLDEYPSVSIYSLLCYFIYFDLLNK
jgi:glutamine synthetase